MDREITAAGPPILDFPCDGSAVARETAGTARLLPHGRTLAGCACAAGEFLLLVATGLPLLLANMPGPAPDAVLAAVLAAASAVGALVLLDAYAMRVLAASRPPFRAILSAASAGCLICLATVVIAPPRRVELAAVLWFVAAWLLLVLGRTVLAPVIAGQFRRGALVLRVVVLGAQPNAERVRAGLRALHEAGIVLCVADPLQDGWESLERFCRERCVDVVVLDRDEAAEAARRMPALPVEILCMASPGGTRDAGGPRRHMLTSLGLTRLQVPVLTERDLVAKTAFDIVVSGLLLLAILPTLALVAVAIKLDSRGPVLFRQPRVGYGNVIFQVLKFRTMYQDMTDVLAARQTERGDPRVTRVGRLLRRFSIDELPQLLNVLRGEMSLVGPRPHAPHTSVSGALLHHAVAGYALRHRVKPGITGWAQINGARGALRTREQLETRLRLDLDYIKRWSLPLDLRILVITLFREIFNADVY